MKKKIKRKWVVIITLFVLLSIETVAISSYAYKTDRSIVINDFTTAHFEIRLSQPEYENVSWYNSNITTQGGQEISMKTPAYAMVQNKVLTEDPKVVNNSTVMAYMLLEVTIPKANVMLTSNAPAISEGVELFKYTVEDPAWCLMDSKDLGNRIKRLYMYTQPIEVGDSTSSLFKEVTFADVVEGQLRGNEELEIHLCAYGIQQPTFEDYLDAYSCFDWEQGYVTDQHRHEEGGY